VERFRHHRARRPLRRAEPRRPGTPAAGALKLTQNTKAVTIDTGVLQAVIPLSGRNLVDSLTIGGTEVARAGQLVYILQAGPATENEDAPPREKDLSIVKQVTVEQPGLSTAYGVSRPSELTLYPGAGSLPKKALEGLFSRGGGFASPKLLTGPDVLSPAEEALEVNTNEAAQTGLTTIELLELCKDQLPVEMPPRVDRASRWPHRPLRPLPRKFDSRWVHTLELPPSPGLWLTGAPARL